MSSSQPTICRPQAYRLLKQQLPQIETSRGLLRAAVAVSMHELERIDPVDTEAEITAYAETICSRVHSDSPKAMLAHLHALLFDEEGFIGNAHDYDNPYNSYLPLVLSQQMGLPITLTMVYKLVADELGLPVFGINAPGHFLAGVHLDGAIMLVDPFDRGRELTQDEAFDRIEAATGAAIERVPEWFEPVEHRQWIARVIRNLVRAFQNQDRLQDARAMVELLQLVLPDDQLPGVADVPDGPADADDAAW